MTNPPEPRPTDDPLDSWDHLSELDPDCGEYTDEDIYYQGMSDMEDK